MIPTLIEDRVELETIPYKKLWAAVLLQAARDLYDENKAVKSSAFYWFKNDRRGINAFLDICELLGLNAVEIRRMCNIK